MNGWQSVKRPMTGHPPLCPQMLALARESGHIDCRTGKRTPLTFVCADLRRKMAARDRGVGPKPTTNGSTSPKPSGTSLRPSRRRSMPFRCSSAILRHLVRIPALPGPELPGSNQVDTGLRIAHGARASSGPCSTTLPTSQPAFETQFSKAATRHPMRVSERPTLALTHTRAGIANRRQGINLLPCRFCRAAQPCPRSVRGRLE